MQTQIIGLMAGALIAGLGYATWTDLRERIIPNPLNAAIALAAPLWWWACGMHLWPDLAIQLGIAGAVFLLFVGAFAIGAMGGGDVKLIGALGLWLLPFDFITMIIWMSIGGGVLTVVMMLRHKIRKIEGPLEVPYGVAIALAAIPLLAERYIYHFA
jgi:prepilin peptidase CpaA